MDGRICGVIIWIVVTIIIIAGSRQERDKTMEDNTASLAPKKAFDLKKFGHEIALKIQRMGFWVLVLIALGCFIGIYYSKIFYNSSIEDGIKMQRMVHNNIIYDITISSITQPK